MQNTCTNRGNTAFLLTYLLTGAGFTHAQPPAHFEAGIFSSFEPGENLPDGWQPLNFSGIERHTNYSLVKENDTVVIKAVSNQSASGLTRAISIDPEEYPFIQWSWKVNNLLQKGDVTRKDGDDYPARVYITFAFDPDKASFLEKLEQKAARLIHGQDLPYRAIAYIWGSNSPAGTMIANSYTDRVQMFVVQGGDEKLKQWVMETRDVYEDYKTAFAKEPTMITGVAIMTDTDNTQESAIAWYGDIVFSNDRGGPD